MAACRHRFFEAASLKSRTNHRLRRAQEIRRLPPPPAGRRWPFGIRAHSGRNRSGLGGAGRGRPGRRTTDRFGAPGRRLTASTMGRSPPVIIALDALTRDSIRGRRRMAAIRCPGWRSSSTPGAPTYAGSGRILETLTIPDAGGTTAHHPRCVDGCAVSASEPHSLFHGQRLSATRPTAGEDDRRCHQPENAVFIYLLRWRAQPTFRRQMGDPSGVSVSILEEMDGATAGTAQVAQPRPGTRRW